ncbi:hypothetical protein BpHYR1_000925 [Brachionus plicatilis]|uniref:Uncharacterized protein n=1 Tax=Brachionus plicatilis TaxID=10195 RepID=A0A3M7QAB0_BRAPC|nr:hypothetical protein BpHYR1_000925 [Brachionus plicatilis]
MLRYNRIFAISVLLLGGGQIWPVRTRQKHRRTAKCTATLAVRQNQRKFFSLIWFDRKFRHPSLIWMANFAVQIFGRRSGRPPL